MHLKGVTDLSEIQRYLKTKYNRPHEIVGSLLNKGTILPWPGENRKISKANCLILLEIILDLKKYARSLS